MQIRIVMAAIVALVASAAGCTTPAVDPALASYISTIKAVDNHTHVNSVVAADSESDALPLDGLPPFSFPARLDWHHPAWIAAYRALYGYAHDNLDSANLPALRDAMHRVAKEQGAKFPEWVLDQIGTEVMLANRIELGPGLAPPRFRWVSYVDALMLPLSTMAERAASPDYRVLYPLEEKLLRRYLAEVHLTKVPATLEEYQRQVVTPTLERQRQGGAVAVKFEAAYLRTLDFDDASFDAARGIYARYAGGGTPTHAEYKTLEDYLFRHIAREAGRLGMAVHTHAFEGGGGFYHVAGSDPLLMEPAFNDSTLRGTNFVIIHGGGIFAAHAGAMLWKPNVYVDISMMTVIYTPSMLASVLKPWLEQFPDRVLFGTDAFANGPDAGWELAAWVGTSTARKALGLALTDLMREGTFGPERAKEIATMVLRTNAAKLYKLQLH